MNAPIIDPLQGDFPEVIEEFLDHGVMKCVAFNRRGTLLAAGCSDGSCVIWDFETRSIAKELRTYDCVSAITSVSWSKYGHRILVSAADKSLTLWDVVKGEKIGQTTLQQMPLLARLDPGSSTPSTCLACPISSPPVIVDLITSKLTALPISLSETSNAVAPPSRQKDGFVPFAQPTAACFNKYGDLVYVGNSKGEILIIDHINVQIRAIISIPGGGLIKNIVFSRNGQYLLTNSNDRTIRIYENLLPLKGGVKILNELNVERVEQDEFEKLKAVGSRSLALFREFQDLITKVQWKAPCFSGDGEWVVGGSASKGEHKIYVWDRTGRLVKILEGPKEAVIDLAWHPVRPVVVSVSMTGLIYIWAKDSTENWSAFAPDFKELEENEEYVEREDEFDLMPDKEKVRDSDIDEDEEIDILTVEKDTVFSDSDMSVDEICFLPADPRPDYEEQEEELASDGDYRSASGSPLSEDNRQNGHSMNHESSTPEEYTGEMRSKRKRKPSEKFLDIQGKNSKKLPSKAESSR